MRWPLVKIVGMITEVECFVTDFFLTYEKRTRSKSGKCRTVGWRDRVDAATDKRCSAGVPPTVCRACLSLPKGRLALRLSDLLKVGGFHLTAELTNVGRIYAGSARRWSAG